MLNVAGCDVPADQHDVRAVPSTPRRHAKRVAVAGASTAGADQPATDAEGTCLLRCHALALRPCESDVVQAKALWPPKCHYMESHMEHHHCPLG